ncbi:MAG TPA: repressor LexA, partial [Leptospiraceae bacterium]|nr:repressor LexA [Leptospiraceae bacterium]
MKDLTDKQQLIISFITDFIMEKGYPPTIREVALG